MWYKQALKNINILHIVNSFDKNLLFNNKTAEITFHNKIKNIPKHQQPYEFHYLHNNEKFPDRGTTYGQHIEPAGKYMIETDSPLKIEPRYESGKLIFKRPFVIKFGDNYQSSNNWKAILSKQYGGLTGIALSKALIADGYDGIITVDEYGTSEIVSLQDII